jgi:hypothetical protein
MLDLYDPYRNAVRHSLEDKANERRKKIFIQKTNKEKTKNFLQKKLYLTDFINLPKGFVNLIFFIMFLLIPYTFGAIFTFILLAKFNFHIYENMHNTFAFLWIIGYELVATLLLTLILKSSIDYR